MLHIVAFALIGAFMTHAVADEKQPGGDKDALAFKMESLAGEQVDLGQYKGKVVLIVNTASECGLTPQYAGLQKLHEKYADKGLAILGFPCNQFGKQEPGTAKEISEFCTKNYGVTFDMFAKIKVNGSDASELYKLLTAIDAEPAGTGDISWNFEKFLVSPDGKVLARFSPRTKPDDEQLVAAIEAALTKK